jgi:hypothetical protein
MRGFCRLLVHLWDAAVRKWEGAVVSAYRGVGVTTCRRIGEEKQSVRSIQVDETYATSGTPWLLSVPGAVGDDGVVGVLISPAWQTAAW